MLKYQVKTSFNLLTMWRTHLYFFMNAINVFYIKYFDRFF